MGALAGIAEDNEMGGDGGPKSKKFQIAFVDKRGLINDDKGGSTEEEAFLKRLDDETILAQIEFV